MSIFSFYLEPESFFMFIWLKLTEQAFEGKQSSLKTSVVYVGQAIHSLIDPYSQCQF